MTPTGFCGRAALAIAHGQATTADGARSSGTASADARATSIGDARMEGLAVLQAELADTRLAVVRVGTNLNQAVRALHATGEAPVWLEHVVALCGRALAAVDAAATRVHRRP